jgi:hypothetical protein
MVKETGIPIKPLTCNKSLKLENINMIKMHRVHLHNVVSSTPRHKLLDVPYNVEPEQLSFIFCLINKMREITFYKTLSILRSL